MVFCSGYRKPYKYTIKAEKDAFYHNNVGLNYLKDRIYYAAIQEFKIAISLSPSTQATAIFYNNLGETYTFIGYPEQAVDCFENALKLYGLNFKYYLNIANCYKNLGLTNAKIKEFSNSENIYDRIKLGLLCIEAGDVRKGVNILDEFCIQEPDLLITPAIRQYLQEVIEAKL
jgi:tetratricopeptide (TPR) repeat protein